MATDPVCKKAVDENAPVAKANYWGKVFFFCSEECRKVFRRDPPKFAPETAEGKGPGYDKSRLSENWRT